MTTPNTCTLPNFPTLTPLDKILPCKHLSDDILEVRLFPGVSGMIHHGDDCIVVLLILVIQEYQLTPKMRLLCCPQHLCVCVCVIIFNECVNYFNEYKYIKKNKNETHIYRHSNL